MQGKSLNPVILYSMLEWLAFILRFFSILLAWGCQIQSRSKSRYIFFIKHKSKLMGRFDYFLPVNLMRISNFLIRQEKVHHWPWLYYHCSGHICTKQRQMSNAEKKLPYLTSANINSNEAKRVLENFSKAT